MKLKRQILPKPRVEMLPLIDSVFLILIFFIYAFLSMTVHKGINLDLPVSSSAVVNKEDYQVISVKENGALFFNKEPVDADALIQKIESVFYDNPSTQFYLAGDCNAKHADIIKVLDNMRQVGIKKISLETNGEK